MWSSKDVKAISSFDVHTAESPNAIRDLCNCIPEKIASKDIDLLATSGIVVVAVQPNSTAKDVMLTGKGHFDNSLFFSKKTSPNFLAYDTSGKTLFPYIEH